MSKRMPPAVDGPSAHSESATTEPDYTVGLGIQAGFVSKVEEDYIG